MAIDPYLDPATGLLRNRLGITDPAALAAAEAFFTRLRIAQLEQRPASGQFDLVKLNCHGIKPPPSQVCLLLGEIRDSDRATRWLWSPTPDVKCPVDIRSRPRGSRWREPNRSLSTSRR